MILTYANKTTKAHVSLRICMARSQPLLFVRHRYGPRETFKRKMEAVDRFIDCLIVFLFEDILSDRI